MNSDSGRNERLQILALLHEPHGQRAAGLNQHVVQMLVAGEFVPGQIGIQKDKAQVVNFAIVLAMFEQLGIVLGAPAPFGTAGAEVELPHHAGQKAAGPIGPQFPFVMPAAADGVDRKKIGMLFDQRGNLPLGEFEGFCIAGSASVGHA